MGLFKKSKKLSTDQQEIEKEKTPWRVLNSMEQLDEIMEQSKNNPVAIFKHSTRCGISRMVLKQFENSYSLNDTQLKLYYLDLLNYRNISDEVGYKFQVLHQSPQLIVVKNRVAVSHTSHHAIEAADLNKFI